MVEGRIEKKKRKSRIRNINSELPADTVQVILSKVPLLNLPSCRVVCKAWNNLILSCKFDPPILISNLFFAHISPFRKLHCVDFDPKHLGGMSSVASFRFDAKNIFIINSCNGLLFLNIVKNRRGQGRRRRRVLGILNPMTNEYIKLPSSKSRGKGDRYGLGFSPKTKQYKIARTCFLPDECTTLVEIFAFGTSPTHRQWTPVGFLPNLSIFDRGVYFNGGLYWIGDVCDCDCAQSICRLDIENEKLEQISLPRDDGLADFIGVVNGSLHLTICAPMEYDDNVEEYQVWKMEEDCSWIKAFGLQEPKNLRCPGFDLPLQCTGIFLYNLQPIKACEDGKMLCLFVGFHLLLYDPKTQRVEVLTDQDLNKHMCVHRIDSFNFNSLCNILAGKC